MKIIFEVDHGFKRIHCFWGVNAALDFVDTVDMSQCEWCELIEGVMQDDSGVNKKVWIIAEH